MEINEILKHKEAYEKILNDINEKDKLQVIRDDEAYDAHEYGSGDIQEADTYLGDTIEDMEEMIQEELEVLSEIDFVNIKGSKEETKILKQIFALQNQIAFLDAKKPFVLVTTTKKVNNSSNNEKNNKPQAYMTLKTDMLEPGAAIAFKDLVKATIEENRNKSAQGVSILISSVSASKGEVNIFSFNNIEELMVAYKKFIEDNDCQVYMEEDSGIEKIIIDTHIEEEIVTAKIVDSNKKSSNQPK
jgi:hypothetical protein